MDQNIIKGLLVDLDGVVYIGSDLIEGANETIDHLRHLGMELRFITNTTKISTSSLMRKIKILGLHICENEVLTPPIAAKEYLKKFNNPKCRFLIRKEVREEFEEFENYDSNPEFIIIGDIGDFWNYVLVNDIFNQVMNGASIVALHKGKFWVTEEGLKIDFGAFITGIEYATGKEAKVMGKPSPYFYNMALESIGLKKHEVLMIGDDIDSDIGGAQEFGIKSWLVKTGKYHDQYVEKSAIKPDRVLNSIADLQNIFK